MVDWIVQTLAVAGLTVLVIGGVLVATARTLQQGAGPAGRRRDLPELAGEPEAVLHALRRPLFDADVEVGAPTERAGRPEVVLGWRGQRYRLSLAASGAELVGPEGPDADALVEQLLAAHADGP